MKRIIRSGTVVAAALLAPNVAALDVGIPAPDFSAPSTQGTIVLSERLSNGPIVLAQYYADFTSG